MLPHPLRTGRAPRQPTRWVRSSRSVLTTGAVLLVLAACGGDDRTSVEATPTSAAADATAGSSATTATTDAGASGTAGTSSGDTSGTSSTSPDGQPIELLRFTAPLLGGGTFDGGSAATERPIVFWFWAPT